MAPGAQLRAWRRGQLLSRRALASRWGVSANTIERWEGGQVAPMRENARTIERWAGIPASSWPHPRHMTAPSNPQTPGEELRAWRVGRRWTQSRLAVEVGCTGAAVSYWESGEYVPLGICAQRLERITGIPADAWAERRAA